MALPLLPPVHGPEQAQQVGPLVDVPDQLAAGRVPRPEAQLVQLRQKIPARPGSPAGGLDQGGVEVPLRPGGPEQRQLIAGKAVHRGAQGGDEGHILAGIVHDLEKGQGHIHLGGGKEVLPALGRPGHAPLSLRART